MKQFDFENYEKNLPDCYDKRPVKLKDGKYEGSNNSKLLKIDKASATHLKIDIQSIFDCLNIDNATGKTLNLYGEMVGQERGYATDVQYRMMIKAKIARNHCNGDYKSVSKALCLTFNCNPQDIYIVDGEEPLTVEVKKIPFSIINNAGFSATQAVAIIKQLLPPSVKVVGNFTGTFAFTSNATTKNAEKGFANLDRTTGGYFGAIITSGVETDLPI